MMLTFVCQHHLSYYAHTNLTKYRRYHMCTAVTYNTNNFYFGRNLDIERDYGEIVVITPRQYPFLFRSGVNITDHYAMIGMAVVAEEYPLYFDATNEKGLSMAGLNFPGNAKYYPIAEGRDNVSPFELIPWVLCQCEDTRQALKLLNNINIWHEPFSEAFPLSPLHWILADACDSYTLEATQKGFQIYDNPVGILTNNPCFEFHMQNLSNYMNLTAKMPENRFSDKIELLPYSFGMGAMGLPGDPSSASRFIRAAFTKLNAVPSNSEEGNVSQFFHMLGSVVQQKGVTILNNGEHEYTKYSSCCNADKGIYYYTTYENRRICAVDMRKEQLDSRALIRYPLQQKQDVLFIN